jgi:uncharacterized protein (TIGR03435 family)
MPKYSCFATASLAALLLVGLAGRASLAQANAADASSSGIPDWQIEAGRKLEFEVATVKPNTSDADAQVNFTLGPGDRYADTGGRFLTKNISLLDYIRFAYKLSDGQVEILQASAPNWIASERFDIQARSELPHPTKDQMRLMMQFLLAERFALRAHAETRPIDALALVLVKQGKPGPQLRPHPSGDATCSNVARPTDPGVKTSAEIPSICGALMNVGVPGAASRVRIGGQRVPLALLAAQLGQMGGFDRPIVDQTGLSGNFDLVLEWGSDSAEVPRDESNQQVYMLNALKEQLGLKLERRKVPLTIVLVDHIDRQPTGN